MFNSVDLLQPLTSSVLSSTSLLSEAIDENLLTRTTKVDPYVKRLFGIAFNTAISASGKIPYLSVAMHMDLPYPLRVLGASVEMVAFGLLDVWVIADTANDLCGARTHAELQLLAGNSRGLGAQSLIMIAAIAGAAFAQLPSALPALNYQVPYTAESFAVLMASGMYYSVRSLKLSFEKALDKRSELKLENGPKIAAARQALAGLFATRQEYFLKSDQTAQLEFARSMKGIRLEAYLENSVCLASDMADTQVQETVDKVIYCFGIYFAVFMQMALALYTWEETDQHLTSNKGLLIAFTGGEMASNIYLMGRSMIDTVAVVANTLLCRKGIPSMAEKLNGPLTQKLKLLATLIALVGCYPTTWVIWGDFFADPAVALYFQLTMCVNFFLLLLTANLSLAEQIVEEVTLYKGTEEQKIILGAYRDLKQLHGLVERSSLKDFAIFLQNSCPQSIRQKLLEQTKLSEEELQQSINPQHLRSLSIFEKI